ncbi:MAG: hypothetical protein EOS63_17205 [Mesorhizobium sp.]|uniref:hypothetical protein n=1 Tax=Mesorhizobium sp. TaxID=1871066 RepID=UPI000FE9C773|nr:hypothetical protein [Mesorhizobium sp.]RWE78583.1 MAG: hypothetical protein EOS63_17205 [Mesorhizobium sp.]TIU43526.1 MAG: hypothetical protein E5W31_03300 [Mesorhizobium sp.]TJW58223.1 MAG: hypothetical protein E5V97_33485 [Mesorhizobium sp.]
MNMLNRENQFAPGKLWSLWEIAMKEHSAQRLVGALKLVMRQLAIVNRVGDNDDVDIENIKENLRHLKNVCEQTALPVSVEAITRELYGFANRSSMMSRIVRESLETIHSTVENELATILFLRVSTEYIRYHKDPAPFGQRVADAFPLAIRDIEHGTKALTYGLGTSCVFHMMRVMEMGLKVLAKKLGIPYAPSWESYITQIETKITAKHKTKGIKWKRDEPFFRDVLGSTGREDSMEKPNYAYSPSLRSG